MNLESDAASMAEERIESAEELFKDGTFIHPVESEWISSVHLMRGMRSLFSESHANTPLYGLNLFFLCMFFSVQFAYLSTFQFCFQI